MQDMLAEAQLDPVAGGQMLETEGAGARDMGGHFDALLEAIRQWSVDVVDERVPITVDDKA